MGNMASGESKKEHGGVRPAGQRKSRRWRKAVLLLALWTLVPLGILGGLEGTLRWAGYGQSTRPFHQNRQAEVPLEIFNQNFYYQFLYNQTDQVGIHPTHFVVPPKQDQTYRVFVFGASSAMGWYFADYAFWRVLETMFETAYPGVRFEFHSLAYFGMNSHVMRHLAHEVKHFEPDLFLVYLGNNEMCGPFGLLSALGRKDLSAQALGRMVRWHILLSDLRLMQFLGKGAQDFSFRSVGGLQWGTSAPVERIDDPRLLRVYAHYRMNLDAICDAAQDAGAAVALCTVGRNLRDWRPQNSVHTAAAQGSKEAWEAHFAAGKARQDAGDYTQAISEYNQAVKIDPLFADLHYRLGQCHQTVADFDKARDHFTKAMEQDFTFSCANAYINKAIAEVATAREDESVWFIDTAERLIEASPNALSGREFFYDHIHLTFEGNYEIARAVFERAAPELPEWLQAKRALTEPPPLETCRARLGLSKAQRLFHVNKAIETHERLWPEQDIGHLRAWRDRLKTEVDGDETAGRLEGYMHALKTNPEDPPLLFNAITILNSLGRMEEAFPLAESCVTAHPRLWLSRWLLADTFTRMGRYDEAEPVYAELLRRYPEIAESHYQHAQFLRATKRYEEAAKAARQAARLKPANSLARWAEGNALREAGHFEAAVKAYLRGIAVNPSGAALLYGDLARTLNEAKEPQRALEVWRKLDAQYENAAEIPFRLGDTLVAQGDVEQAIAAYTRAIAMDGQYQGRAADALVRQLTGIRRDGDLDTAIAGFRAALTLDPEHASARRRLVRTLQQQGTHEEAIELARQATEIAQPGDEAFRDYDTALRNRDDLEARIAAWHEAAAANPDSPFPLLYLGRGLGEAGERESALAAWRKAAQLPATTAELLRTLGECQYLAKDYAEAASSFERALAGDDAPAAGPCTMLVESLLALDRKDNARAWAERCREAGVDLGDTLLRRLNDEAAHVPAIPAE